MGSTTHMLNLKFGSLNPIFFSKFKSLEFSWEKSGETKIKRS